MEQRVRWTQNRLLDFATVLFAVVGVARLALVLPARATQNDFAHYYVTSHLVLEGRNPYGVPLAPLYAARGLVYQEEVAVATNPPTLLWLFAPLGLLPARAAFWVWTMIQAASLAVILVLTRRLLRERLSARGWRFVVAGTLASAPVYWHFVYAQWQLPLAALVLAAFAWQAAGKHTLACLTVSAAALVKLYPAVLLPWFVWRSGRLWARNAAMTFVFAAAVVAVTGVDRWADFFAHGLPPLTEHAVNHSFIYTVPALVANLGHATPTWWVAGVAMGAALIAGSYVACWRMRGDVVAQFCLLSVAMLAGVFKAEGHYLVFMIFPVAVACVAAGRSLARCLWVACVIALLNCLATVEWPWLDRHLMLKVLANNLPLYGLLGLVAFFAAELRRPAEGS